MFMIVVKILITVVTLVAVYMHRKYTERNVNYHGAGIFSAQAAGALYGPVYGAAACIIGGAWYLL